MNIKHFLYPFYVVKGIVLAINVMYFFYYNYKLLIIKILRIK